jgi:hypothetical protein
MVPVPIVVLAAMNYLPLHEDHAFHGVPVSRQEDGERCPAALNPHDGSALRAFPRALGDLAHGAHPDV